MKQSAIFILFVVRHINCRMQYDYTFKWVSPQSPIEDVNAALHPNEQLCLFDLEKEKVIGYQTSNKHYIFLNDVDTIDVASIRYLYYPIGSDVGEGIIADAYHYAKENNLDAGFRKLCVASAKVGVKLFYENERRKPYMKFSSREQDIFVTAKINSFIYQDEDILEVVELLQHTHLTNEKAYHKFFVPLIQIGINSTSLNPLTEIITYN